MSTITFKFHAHECNGWPKARIRVADQVVADFHIEQTYADIGIEFAAGGPITVERYGKEPWMQTATQDQMLEIIDVLVDGVPIPRNILTDLCKFEWHGSTDAGSLLFGPNGTWTLDVHAPILTYLLDYKIVKESKYNQDYLYPWSYRLGPESVEQLHKLIDAAEERAHQVL